MSDTIKIRQGLAELMLDPNTKKNFVRFPTGHSFMGMEVSVDLTVKDLRKMSEAFLGHDCITEPT